MWRLIFSLLLAFATWGQTTHPILTVGSAAPGFSLPGVDGKVHRLADYAASPVLVVVFTCNHCPIAQMYEERIQQLETDYSHRGVAIVAIQPNDPKAIRIDELDSSDISDSLDEMKIRVEYKHLHYPYLYDGETQSATREVPVNHTGGFGCSTKWQEKAASRAEALRKIEEQPVKLEMATAADLKRLRENPAKHMTLISFWATWCGSCIDEFSDFEATYQMYKERDLELVTVSANMPDERASVLRMLEKKHATSRNLLFASNDTAALQAAFDPTWESAVPYTVLLDANGNVLYKNLGSVDILKLRRTILANLPSDYEGFNQYWSEP